MRIIKNLELSQMIVSKLCHELAGAVGVVTNCADLLSIKSDGINDEARQLMVDQSDALIDMIKWVRFVYGADEPKVISIDEAKALIISSAINSNIKLELHVDQDYKIINLYLVKAISCLIGIASANLFKKTGNVDVYMQSNITRVISTGQHVKMKKECCDILNGHKGQDTIISIFNCLEYYTSEICGAIDYKLSLKQNSDTIEYIMTR